MRQFNFSSSNDLPALSSELKEIRLPYRDAARPAGGARDTLARAEQQIDLLIEMLAAEQATEQRSSLSPRPMARDIAEQAAEQVIERLVPRRRSAEYRHEQVGRPALASSPPALDTTALDTTALDTTALDTAALDCRDATGTATPPVPAEPALELSIVMPCLDEADTVGNCVLKAFYAIDKMGITGEVIVADNGSRDDSVEIAEALGARVVHVDQPGYGAALMGGIEAARGRFVLMGDADDSYDFTQAQRFYRKLCDGAELVQGCRLPSGGGRIMPGAMPWLHQFGNPGLTWLVQKMFKAPIHDVYCGMRGFTKELYGRLDQRCTGMEFATEMIIKSTLFGARIDEVPIVLHPDGRKAHRPHLRTFRDGWRTLRFFMMLSPRWTFLAPGLALGAAGLVGCLLVMSRVSLAGVVFDAHTLLVSMVMLLVAAQLGCFAVLAKTFAASEGILPKDTRVERLSSRCTLERIIFASVGLIASGAAVVAWKSLEWATLGFGQLDYSETMRWIVPAVGAIALGCQLAFSGFLLSILRLARR